MSSLYSMPRLNVDLSDEQYDFLKSIKGVSISAWVRVAINDAIRKEKLASMSASASVKE